MCKIWIWGLVVLTFLAPRDMSGALMQCVQKSSEATKLPDNKEPDGQVFPKEMYMLISHGDGRAGDGTVLNSRLYKSSDGTKITTIHGHFLSISAAKAEFNNRINEARKVIERGPKRGFLGHEVGERCVIILSAANSSSEHTAVVWTNGTDFYEITSVSRKLVIDMEKRYYK